MAAERVARHDEDHQTLVVDVDVIEERWPITVSGRHVELELSERNAEWLCTVGLPAALARARARRRAA
jgi:hypothetical protein